MTIFGKIVVSYTVPNFRDREPTLEGSKIRPRPRLCVQRPRLAFQDQERDQDIKTNSRDQDLSLKNYITGFVNSTQLKFITALWSVDQIAQLITINDSRVHKMKKKQWTQNVHSEILYMKRGFIYMHRMWPKLYVCYLRVYLYLQVWLHWEKCEYSQLSTVTD